MRLPRTPEHLRHIPATLTFGGIAAASVDPRFGSPALGVAAAAVAVGLLLKKSFAKPMGAGLAASWLLFLVFAHELPQWTSPEWALAELGVIALSVLAFTQKLGRMSARGTLACASAGLVVGLLRWHRYDELWVLERQLPTLAVLAGAGLLAIFRPRPAASLVVALAGASAFRLPQSWLALIVVAAAWWLAEYGIRAYEQRPTAPSRFAGLARGLGGLGLVGWAVLALRPYLEHGAHLSSATWIASVVLVGALGVAILARREWAAPLAVGLGLTQLANLGARADLAMVVAALLLAPAVPRLDARRGLALVGAGAAAWVAFGYVGGANMTRDPGNIVLAAVGLASSVAAVWGFARSRTWGVVAAGVAFVSLFASTQAISGTSAHYTQAVSCFVINHFPAEVAVAALLLPLAAYARPVIGALRPPRVS